MQSYTDQQFWDSYYKKFQPHTVEKVLFADLFTTFLSPDPNKTVLEIGCAGGDFLCYLAKHFHYQAFGVDYSDEIDTTNELFAYNHLPAPTLYREDIFTWNPMRQFDIVCSFGLVEHFEDLEGLIQKHVALLKTGGILIVTMPHFAHVQYFFHWLIDRENLKKHNTKIMNIASLRNALPSSIMQVLHLNYYRTFSFWTERAQFAWWELPLYHAIQLFGRVVNKLAGLHRPNPLFSPHLICIARKTADNRPA